MNWAGAKKQAAARDDGKCQRCFSPATDVHHRKPKGMGGTSDQSVTLGLANLICLCRGCHHWVHANPAEAYVSGFLVHSWQDPAEIPVGRDPGDWLF